MRNFLHRLLFIKPIYWGGVYLLIVPIFGFIFSCLPKNSFNISINSFFEGLYLSSVVISTLGFGDIYPITNLAKIMVLIEALLGVLLVGFFLNSLANLQAQNVSNEEKDKTKREKLEVEKRKLERIYNYVKLYQDRYLLYLYQVVTPIEKRDFADMKFSFTYNDMYDLYSISTLSYDDFNEPLIKYYYSKYEHYYNALEKLLFEVDLDLFPEITLLLKGFFEFNDENSFKESIISFNKTMNRDKMVDIFIKDFNEPIEYRHSAIYNQFIGLYKTVNYNLKFIAELQELVSKNIK